MVLLAVTLAVLGVFIAAYVLFALRERFRLYIAAGAALVSFAILVGTGTFVLSSGTPCALFGYVPSGSPWSVCGEAGYVQWDALGLLFGLLMLSALLHRQGFFKYVAVRLTRASSGKPLPLFLALSLLTFGLSAFLNSISVMVVMATITIEISRATGLSPIPFLLAEISASNAGGAATFVGDPPNVILGTYLGLGFNDFLLYAAPLALGAMVAILILFWWMNRKHLAPGSTGAVGSAKLPELPRLDMTALVPAVAAFVATLVLLAVNASIPLSVGEIGLLGGALALVLTPAIERRSLLVGLDWEILGFIFFLFLVVGTLRLGGFLDLFARGLEQVGGSNALLTSSLLLWTLGLISSVVDNVPLAAVAAPLIATMSSKQGFPVGSLAYASAVGLDVGGNGTPIGASANVAGLSVARRLGVAITWKEYLRQAFPVMIVSLAAANLVLIAMVH